jgi:hypothetical protein
MMYNFMGSYYSQACSKRNRTRVRDSDIRPRLCACMLPILNKSSTVELLRSDKVFPFVVLPITSSYPQFCVIFYPRKKLRDILAQKKSSQTPSR